MAGKNSIQILRSGPNYNPKDSEELLLDGQPLHSKKNNQLYVGDGTSLLKDLKPVTSYLYADDAGEYSVSLLSRNGAFDGYEVFKNITNGRSSFTIGQYNRNGGYQTLVSGETNTVVRLKEDQDNGIKAFSCGNDLVSGSGQKVAASFSIVGGSKNYISGSKSLAVGLNNNIGTPLEYKAYLEAYYYYMTFGVDDEGYICRDKNKQRYGTIKDDIAYINNNNSPIVGLKLNDLKFINPSVEINGIIAGKNNTNISTNSIISGKQNEVYTHQSAVFGGENKLLGRNDFILNKYENPYFAYNTIFGKGNTIRGRYISILGNSNNVTTPDETVFGVKNVHIIGDNNKIERDGLSENDSAYIIIGNEIENPEDPITLGNTSPALTISGDSKVKVHKTPTEDLDVIRKIDLSDGTFSASFNELRSLTVPEKDSHVIRRIDLLNKSFTPNFSSAKVQDSQVITLIDFDDTKKATLREQNPKFNSLKLGRTIDNIGAYDAIRLADISTRGSTGAFYGALDVKFSKIQMKATPGNVENNPNIGNGSTVILPDKITSNEFIINQSPTDNKHAVPKKYVDDKFNGANKAVSFVNYSAMIASLNSLANTGYSVGQNIMIVTLEVPDLWVSEIAEESVAYTYVSDTDFVNELTTNGSVQVGYYKLSALETQKVDLTNYVKNTDWAQKNWEKKGGVISFYSNSMSSGIQRYVEGDIVFPFIYPANNATFQGRSEISYTPLVPKHINAIVKGALTGDKRIGQGTVGTDAWAVAEFTDYEKAQARSILGFEGKYLHKVTITSTVTQTQTVETTTMLILSAKQEALTVEQILTEEKDNIIDITRNDGTEWTANQFIYQPEDMGIVFEFYAGGDWYDHYFSSVDLAEEAVTDVVLS